MFKVFSFIFVVLYLTGCSGYHLQNSGNPFYEYNVKSISVPMFLNRSIITDIGPKVTHEIFSVLNDYDELKIYSGESKKADAILLGIITSASNNKGVFKSGSSSFTSEALQESIGNRSPLYIPTSVTYNFTIRFVLIKNPTSSDIQFILSPLGEKIRKHPKIILDKSFAQGTTLSRVVDETLTSDSGGIVNYTSNQGLLKRSLDELAKSIGSVFRETVLDAF